MAALTARRDAALSLGAPDSVSHFVLAPILRDLALRHPELVLHVESANSPAMDGKLERREVDLAFVVYERNLPGVLDQLVCKRRDALAYEDGARRR